MTLDFSHVPMSALIIAGALCALLCALLIPTATRGARIRAAEKARAWAQLKRPDWEARAERKRAQRASGARTEARLRGALMSGVALVALAATNLSAHATINAMRLIGLTTLDTAISVIVVFEAFLGILGALSWWHRRSGTGFNVYEAGVWAMAALMGGIAWWGGENPIFALWPMLAAVAWHVVVTFGKDRKPSPLVRWWRLRFGTATDEDATSIDNKRRWSRMSAHGYYAHEGVKILRPMRARMLKRAQMRAQQLGIMTDEARAYMQTCTAALYYGARAFSPEAVARMNPWTDERASAQSAPARKARTERAPERALTTSAHEDQSAPARAESAPDKPRTSALIERAPIDVAVAVKECFTGPSHALEWAVQFWETNGKLPTGGDLATEFGLSAGNCRKWMAPVNRRLKEA